MERERERERVREREREVKRKLGRDTPTDKKAQIIIYINHYTLLLFVHDSFRSLQPRAAEPLSSCLRGKPEGTLYDVEAALILLILSHGNLRNSLFTHETCPSDCKVTSRLLFFFFLIYSIH